MAVDAVLARPSVDSIRQPRFQEGSMNDRISAAPPPHFLGPDLEAYERQFYVHSPPAVRENSNNAAKPRRLDRPRSATEQMISPRESCRDTAHGGRPPLAKRSSFFGRLRGALGFGWGAANNAQEQTRDEVKRKHTSLQDHMAPPPLPQQSSEPAPRTWQSQSQIHIPHMPSVPNLGSAASGERPSREEIMQSYQHLMATGFFQAHAIQSTRQPGPRPCQSSQSLSSSAPTPAEVPPQPSRRPPVLPTIPSSGSGLNAKNDVAASMLAALSAASANTRPSQDLARGGSMDWQADQDSRYALRGRKRGRGDGEETSASESALAQPLRKMAKRLRKIPSSLTSAHITPIAQSETLNAIPVQRVPSVTMGGMPYPTDQSLRSRGVSPAAADNKGYVLRRSISASSSISGGPVVNKLQKRAKSPARGRSKPPVSRGGIEAASIRASMESSRREANNGHNEGLLRSHKVRERGRPLTPPGPLGNRPYSSQNVPQVPRIPSIYKQPNVDISSNENTRLRV